MSTIRGPGGGITPSARWKEALVPLEQEALLSVSSKFLNSHRDTEDLRYIAERYRRRSRGKAESSVLFEMDPESGKIMVSICDEVTGSLKLKLSPEEVEKVLQKLEETSDNESTLSSFMIDLKL